MPTDTDRSRSRHGDRRDTRWGNRISADPRPARRVRHFFDSEFQYRRGKSHRLFVSRFTAILCDRSSSRICPLAKKNKRG
jgi:hypothetical protein